jgi:hypothetical protein
MIATFDYPMPAYDPVNTWFDFGDREKTCLTLKNAEIIPFDYYL